MEQWRGFSPPRDDECLARVRENSTVVGFAESLAADTGVAAGIIAAVDPVVAFFFFLFSALLPVIGLGWAVVVDVVVVVVSLLSTAVAPGGRTPPRWSSFDDAGAFLDDTDEMTPATKSPQQ